MGTLPMPSQCTKRCLRQRQDPLSQLLRMTPTHGCERGLKPTDCSLVIVVLHCVSSRGWFMSSCMLTRLNSPSPDAKPWLAAALQCCKMYQWTARLRDLKARGGAHPDRRLHQRCAACCRVDHLQGIKRRHVSSPTQAFKWQSHHISPPWQGCTDRFRLPVLLRVSTGQNGA